MVSDRGWEEESRLFTANNEVISGPPAMKLITLVQVSNAGDEEGAIIAKLLTVSHQLAGHEKTFCGPMG